MNDDELLDACLEGTATADQQARLDADPQLAAELEALRRMRDELRAVEPPSSAAREAALAAALAVFDAHSDDDAGHADGEHVAVEPEPTSTVIAPPTPIGAGRRASRGWTRGLGVAAAALAVVGVGVVVSQRGADAPTAGDTDVSLIEATAPADGARLQVTTTVPVVQGSTASPTAPPPETRPTTTTTPAAAPIDAAAVSPAAPPTTSRQRVEPSVVDDNEQLDAPAAADAEPARDYDPAAAAPVPVTTAATADEAPTAVAPAEQESADQVSADQVSGDAPSSAAENDQAETGAALPAPAALPATTVVALPKIADESTLDQLIADLAEAELLPTAAEAEARCIAAATQSAAADDDSTVPTTSSPDTSAPESSAPIPTDPDTSGPDTTGSGTSVLSSEVVVTVDGVPVVVYLGVAPAGAGSGTPDTSAPLLDDLRFYAATTCEPVRPDLGP